MIEAIIVLIIIIGVFKIGYDSNGYEPGVA